MNNVDINKPSGFIMYDDNVDKWEADMIFNIYEKEISIYGTTRELSKKERNNIISELLNKFCFGNYMNYVEGIYLCKLKNRGLEKNETINENGEVVKKDISYSILGEKIIELPKNDWDNQTIKDLKAMYVNLKIPVNESKKNKIILHKTLTFEFLGNKLEYRRYLRLIKSIKEELEHALYKISGKEIKLFIHSGKMSNKKANIFIELKEV